MPVFLKKMKLLEDRVQADLTNYPQHLAQYQACEILYLLPNEWIRGMCSGRLVSRTVGT
jgi:hypothetical protein